MRELCRALAVVGGVVAAACTRDAMAPDDVRHPPAEQRVVGVVEITFHDIGSAHMTSTALVASSVASLEALHAMQDRATLTGLQPSRTLTLPANSGGTPGNATIELQSMAASAVTALIVPVVSTRYLEATYRVRNAQLDSVAFNTPRRNLTFVAVSTANTLGDTPIRTFLRRDGSPANPALARQLLPTGLVAVNGTGSVVSLAPDVLQVLAEQELTGITLPSDVTNIFPYGFVVKNATATNTRTLNPSPSPTQFDGLVSFAFSIPKQPSEADDPSTISVMLLALDDSDTRVTQSLQEQSATAANAALARATALSASSMTLLPGGSVPGAPSPRYVCSVRTAGTASSPTAFMVNMNASFVSFTPNPYANAGGFVNRTTSFQATFSGPVTGASSSTFPVRGLQSGPAFVGQPYTGNGTATIQTPTKTLLAGEVVEVAVTSTLSCPRQRVARFRISGAPGQGNFFPATTITAGDSASGVALADFNRDGKLDIIATDLGSNNISVFLGNGDGTYGAQRTVAVGRHPIAVAPGDLNGDANIDVAVANELDHTVSVLRGRGDGTFGDAATFAVGTARAIALTHLNGNGPLDIVTANAEGTVSILLNDGTGSFLPQRVLTASDAGKHTSIAVGDLNRDGAMDLVVTDSTFNRVSIWLGNGDGTFQPEREVTVGTGPSSVAIGDFNGDGIPDLAVANQAASRVSVLIGNGDGTFRAPSSLEVGTFPSALAIGDMNGDGKLDIVTVNYSAREQSTLMGNGDGTFQSRRTSFVGDAPRALAIGDIAGTSILGMVVTNGVHAGTVSVFPGRPP